MGIRDLIQEKPAVGIAVVVVVVLVSAGLLLRGSKRAGDATYYDLQSGELFAADSGLLPPIPAPSGGEGVWVRVFACGSCSDKGARFIGFLEKYTEAGKAQVKRTQEVLAASTKENPPPPQPDPERVVSAYQKGQAPQWVHSTDVAGMQIIADIHKRCSGGAKLVRCEGL